ncbi:MAG: hypothetical protein EXS52_02070 [Candidatus Staskawiczbacteria bacterium]|nr:hypothetical protein [Candidatus Staskawiczbacteria bacterium]
MVAIVTASILFSIPFLLTGLFKDKKRGFIYVLFFLLLFHTALAFFTQFFGIFYYQIILIVTILADLVVLGWCFYMMKPWQYNFKNISVAKTLSRTLLIDWMLLAVVVISVLSLYQVHYNYTGKISLVGDMPNEYHEVKNMKYAYPYFSDEWYAVSLMNSSIDSHNLPFNSPFNSSFFLNLELFTHSFLAHIAVLFGLIPLSHYTILSIAMNTLIVVLGYMLLRINAVSKLSSAIATLSILYITSGVNLPGIWNLLPATFGVLFCLILFCFISLGDKKMVLLSFIMASLFYGLLVPFYGLATLVFLLSQLPKSKEALFKVLGFCLILIFLGLILFLCSMAGSFVKYLAGRLFYVPLLNGFVPQFNIFYIIPVPIILLTVIAIPLVFKSKKWLFVPFAVGCVYWLAYLFISYRVIIEFERVVFFTSIIIVLVAGFGSDIIFNFVGVKWKNPGALIHKYGGVLVVALFLLLVPFYSNYSNWAKLISINLVNGVTGVPRAPANNYLTKDDIRIFKDIKHKRFLSVPWKGTVIGVATDNYPVVVKAGTIYFGIDANVEVFLKSDCSGKSNLAHAENLDYIYLSDFDCSGFKKINEGDEGFVLYQFIQ